MCRVQKVQAKASSEEIEGHECVQHLENPNPCNQDTLKKLCRYSSMMQAIN